MYPLARGTKPKLNNGLWLTCVEIVFARSILNPAKGKFPLTEF